MMFGVIITMRLKELREANGFTQKQIAERLGISRKSYSQYERGNRGLPAIVLIALAETYATSADYLLDLTDDPRPYPRAEDMKP